MAGDFSQRRAQELVREAESWDLSSMADATERDVPTLDIARYLLAPQNTQLCNELAEQLRWIGENTGFYLLTGHGIVSAIDAVFGAAADFFALPQYAKDALVMDQPHFAATGIGYLPIRSRRLPERTKGNLNEAIVYKQDRALRLGDNPWPDPHQAPNFAATTQAYAAAAQRVAVALLPLYARALDLPANFFDEAFKDPFFRLRMTRYPRVLEAADDEFGIAPHVDTTFFTLLAQTAPGLVIFGEQQQQWLRVPVVPGALVVNTGELLKQWSNDRFLSIKHFVGPHVGDGDRYSVPFFFNATADYPMACLPTCTNAENPPRYPTVSYLESQAVAQRE